VTANLILGIVHFWIVEKILSCEKKEIKLMCPRCIAETGFSDPSISSVYVTAYL